MKVFKFGGASVKDPEAVKNVGDVMQLFPNENIVVVVSAMGKTTNALERLTAAYYHGTEDPKQVLDEIKMYHNDILSSLFTDPTHPIYSEINNVLVELDWIIEDEPIKGYDFEYDQIVSMGELMSTKIVSHWLNEVGVPNTWVDVRDFLKTDNTYRDAKVDWEETGKSIKKIMPPLFKGQNSAVAITQGFIGVTSENFNTTLGREGSDYTAAIIGSLMDAKEVTIWKDVPGVLNADPKMFADAKKLDILSYHEAIELSFFGASVIHPKTIKPLQNDNIPLKVRSFFNPQDEGTLITHTHKLDELGEVSVDIPSFIVKTDQVLISILPRDFSFIVEENLSSIFGEFAKYGIKVNLMQHAAISFSVCVDADNNRVPDLIKGLQENYKVLYNEGVELVTIRQYDQQTINRLIKDKKVFVEQKSRHTVRYVLREA